jgi:lysozyme family protein
MADFDVSYRRTLQFEGGYRLDGDDRGGETYRGIARRFSPNWSGWKIIDTMRSLPNFPKILEQDAELQSEVRSYFRTHYWEPIWGDSVKDQAIADESFDSAVNLGVRRAIRFLQRSLNLLNRQGSLYPDIREDGCMGAVTLEALSAFLANESSGLLLKAICILRGMHYLTLMAKDPVQEKFARGWLARVKL